jgi:hypothetical protein
MNKKVAGFLFVLDLAFLAVVGYLTWQRYLELQQPAPPPPAPIEAAPMPTPEPVAVSTDTAAVALSTEPVAAVETSSATAVAVSTPVAAVPAGPVPAAPTATAKTTRFTYYSRTAKQVQVVGDFNNWTPQNFRRNAKGGWVISLSIPPGDYSYNYLVDGKTVRDPNQPRTDNQGRSLLSLPRPAASTTNP